MTALLRIQGWYPLHPDLLPEAPQCRADLVRRLDFEAEGRPPGRERQGLYDTEAEAWEVERGWLWELRNQAVSDLAALSIPAGAPAGWEQILPPEKIAALQAEARKQFAIAEAGLRLCPPE
jgi:hypothetical protein